MVAWVRKSGADRIVLALYALAAVSFGFALHPFAMGRAPSRQIELAAYTLPDGTLPVLCATKTASGGSAPAEVHKVCDACALASAPGLLPSSAWELEGLSAVRGVPLPIPPEACGLANEPDNVRSRAPPMHALLKV